MKSQQVPQLELYRLYRIISNPLNCDKTKPLVGTVIRNLDADDKVCCLCVTAKGEEVTVWSQEVEPVTSKSAIIAFNVVSFIYKVIRIFKTKQPND